AFGNGTGRWNNWSRCEIARTQVHAHGGECCAVLSQGTSSMGQLVSGLTPGVTYEVTAWGKVANAGEGFTVGVKEYGGVEKSEKIDTLAYKRISFKFTMGTANTAHIYGYREGGTGV